MKANPSLIALTMLSMFGVACSTTEKSRLANKHRKAYQPQVAVQTEPGLEPVAEGPQRSYTSWGGHMGPF